MFKDNRDPQGNEELAIELLAWAEEQAAPRGHITKLPKEEKLQVVQGLAEGIAAIRDGIDLRLGKINLGDPAIRILLEVILSDKAGRRISLEWLWNVTGIDRPILADSIQTLADLDLVVAMPERFDGRHLWVELSGLARASLFELLLQSAEYLRSRDCGLPL